MEGNVNEELQFEDQELEEAIMAKRRELYVDKRDMAISELYNRFKKADLLFSRGSKGDTSCGTTKRQVD